LQHIVTGVITNYTGFAPLGTVLIALLEVSVAEHSDLIPTTMCSPMMNTSKPMATVTILAAGNFIQHSAIIRLCGTYSLDWLDCGFYHYLRWFQYQFVAEHSSSTAHIIDPTYCVGSETNGYFMFISTFLIAPVAAFVTKK
jgi:aminobenzoyl-glutamate transport protein